ncbi:hypothetical protein ACSQ67_011719 [Phaseolus vulgaris]
MLELSKNARKSSTDEKCDMSIFSSGKGPSVADSIIGEGNTTAWKMCVLDKSTCLTAMFDLSSSDRANTPGAVNPQLYLQFLTSYQDPTGQSVLRVTTVTRRGVDSTVSSEELVQGFDQETAEVVMARFASLKMESEENLKLGEQVYIDVLMKGNIRCYTVPRLVVCDQHGSQMIVEIEILWVVSGLWFGEFTNHVCPGLYFSFLSFVLNKEKVGAYMN